LGINFLQLGINFLGIRLGIRLNSKAHQTGVFVDQNHRNHGVLRVQPRLCKQEVTGSIPVGSTLVNCLQIWWFYRAVVDRKLERVLEGGGMAGALGRHPDRTDPICLRERTATGARLRDPVS
jgi:hypothetical protein